MPFDAPLAAAISNTFRVSISLRLNTPQRTFFESLLQDWFAVKNLRNVQLWTRLGVQTRNFISRNLGRLEMELRVFIADRFIQTVPPTFPVKRKVWLMPPDSNTAREIFSWFQDPYIRAYCTRIFFEGLFFVLEYAADSDTPQEEVDMDSPEFDDLIE